MPIFFALPVGLLVGLSLAWIARAELARSEVPLVLAKPFHIALGFAAIVFLPIIGYFCARHGDWSYLYLVRWARIPSAVDLALVVLAAVQVPVGFALGAPWAVARRSELLLKISGVLLAILVVAAAVTASRLRISGTWAQLHGGFGAVPIGKSPLGRSVLLSWIALFAGYAWTAHALRAAPR